MPHHSVIAMSPATTSLSTTAVAAAAAISSSAAFIAPAKLHHQRDQSAASSHPSKRSSALLHPSPTAGNASLGCRAFSSQRGADAVNLLPSYLADARAVQRYDQETAPDGALQLGVAENQMMEDWLVPAYTKFGSTKPFAADLIYYQPTQGRPSLQDAAAAYMERTFQLSSRPDREGIVLGAGCNAVLENLCLCLAESGQGVLIPTPYYAAFEFDLVARANLTIVPVNTLDYCPPHVTIPPITDEATKTLPIEAYYPTKAGLDAAYERSLENDTEPRILLLSHPNNPLGICYPPEVMKECIAWCRERQIHLVSDEIYAGSVYRESTDEESASSSSSSSSPFTSVIDLAGGAGNLGSFVHLVYSLSKDFASSGLRVGLSYSENTDIRLPMQKLNDLCQISSQTQQLVETMMTTKEGRDDEDDEWWSDRFLHVNHARIRARSDSVMELLTEFDVPHLPADSGLFCWIDFSEFLPELDPSTITEDGQKELLESMEQRERVLYLKLMHEFGLLFTPGMSMRNERPGFFRFVFTAATDEEFALSLERLQTFITAQRNSDGA